MADRRVTQTKKDKDGDILALCNPDQYWSPRSKASAIADIDDGDHTYYVQQPGTDRTDIHVVDDGDGPYLRTDPDGDARNNLDNLPDC
ncbi:MAG: DUF3892 domain-containing protein [Actinobacteria bacterium]|nr:DUF3892 domain-containing protein [Actinomycetota bacterium]